ncbi:hypothetical protein QBC47DRAFT_34224 [Echria macrotheca]|uniref:Uncharacterized protein n=1 Tax=Echria macrotheca TaxID=438768 RepID=A0AAJ0BBM2_9PEZI|nr:hypothetical protein QBC47DRAFT_34224 [Echria macrotheca]
MYTSLPSGIDYILKACEAAGELSIAIKYGQADSNEHHKAGENARAFADLLMNVVILTQELVSSSGLENLFQVTKESADQQTPALWDELSRISARHDGNLSPGSQQRYSLKAPFEDARAASLEMAQRARLGALSESLRRDTEQITALIAQVSRESAWVDYFTLESRLAALDQVVQRVSDSSAEREQRRGSRSDRN